MEKFKKRELIEMITGSYRNGHLTKKQSLRFILSAFKEGRLTTSDVYGIMIDIKLMSTDVLILSSFNTVLMKKMGPKSTLILR